MTENNDFEKSYPVKPDYDKLVFGTALPAETEKKPQESGMGANGGYDVTVLAVVAAVLLVIITLCLLVVSNGMLISHDGKFSFILGEDQDDPFKTVSTTVLSETDAGLDINISDPPAMSVNPVENQGILSAAEIAEQVTPSVVAVMVSGVDGDSIVSGIVLTEDGLIVTSAEALRWMDSVSVITLDGDRYAAALVGMDLSADIAVMKVDATGLDAAVFGNSDAVEVGDTVVAIGTPYDMSLMGTVTSGMVSSINRDIVRDDRVIALIQSDLTVKDGFSGGPIINKYGQIVGIITRSFGEDYDGFGFAVPMNTAKGYIENIVNTAASGEEKEPAASLGINAYFISDRVAEAYGLPRGLVVTDVQENSSTFASGLRSGDIITELDGVRLTDIWIYENVKSHHKVGDKVELTVYRDGNRFDENQGEYLTLTVYFIDNSEFR
ncbi:MAG: trypsin-like peptidase domain-containing protein [Clostridia bacterium]|nr:trypsin-like peptidase domain-containing protein [Clostridia bacterium]